MDENTPIPGLPDQIVLDFWKWGFSDINTNIVRGIYAEFLIGHALGLISDKRNAWSDFDFLYRGVKIEVKSSGYLQSWDNEELSKILFSIKTKKANLHIFSIYQDVDRLSANVLDVSRWRFFIYPTRLLADQDSIHLGALIAKCHKVGIPTNILHSALQDELNVVIKRYQAIFDSDTPLPPDMNPDQLQLF